MEVCCVGVAQVRHKGTGVVHSIQPDQLHWSAEVDVENDLGSEVRHLGEALVEGVGLLVWELVEYPEGQQFSYQVNLGGHELVQDFSCYINRDQFVEDALERDMEEYFNSLPASNKDVLSIYEKSMQEMAGLSLSGILDDKYSIINRMVFSQYISIMETYLCDKIVMSCYENVDVLIGLSERSGLFSGEKVRLSDVLKDKDYAKNIVIDKLRRVIYHDLDKVEKLFGAAFKKGFFPSLAVKKELARYVKYRHDCVHRNGVSIDGGKHSFSEMDLHRVRICIDSLVKHVDFFIENPDWDAF